MIKRYCLSFISLLCIVMFSYSKNENFEWIIPDQYSSVSKSNNFYWLSNDNATWQGADKNGKILTKNPVKGGNTGFMEFSDNTFIVDNGKMNIIDFDGNIINSFDFIFPLKDNRAAVSNNKSWGYINSKGQIVIPLKFERAPNFNDEGQALV